MLYSVLETIALGIGVKDGLVILVERLISKQRHAVATQV